jgi:apolipoprotein N-acyltransferase
MLFLAAAASAATLALSLPSELAPYGIPILGFVCLIPYFSALYRTRSYREAALLGFVFGSLSHFLSSYWLMFFKDYAIWTIGATSVAYGFLHMLVAGFLRRFSMIGVPQGQSCEIEQPTCNPRGYLRGQSTLLRPFAIAAIWTIWECLKSIGFLGYPWGLIAYAVNTIDALNQIADALGVYGLSFLLTLCNAAILEWGLSKKRSLPVFGVLLAISVWFLGYGLFRLTSSVPVVDQVPMVLVQHNGDSWVQGGETTALRKCQELSRKGKQLFKDGKAVLLNRDSNHYNEWDKPALVVWSETVLRRPFDDYKPYFRKQPSRDPFIPFLAELDIPLLTGAPVILDWETYDATNSAILLSPEGEIVDSYAKTHLVPFAETIPFWDYKWMREFMKKVAGLEGQWNAGTEHTVMTIQTPSGRPLRFGVPICFEDAFADTCAAFFKNGADVLINLTNDSWSRTVSAETQHLVVARYRAIENRRVLIRSTNGGVTCIVDAEGRIVAKAPLFEETALAVTVPIQVGSGKTTYFLLGDWFPLLLFFALLRLLFIDNRKNLRDRALKEHKSRIQ